MKIKLVAAITLATAAAASAHLIQLTPGGVHSLNTDPRLSAEKFQYKFFDSAAHGIFYPNILYDGWVSLYGALDGGTYFQVHDFFGRDTDTTAISWDMTGEPHGYWMTMIIVGGLEDGVQWDNYYRVSKDEWFHSSGNLTILAHEGAIIDSIDFYGTDHSVPDTGSTFLLFGIGLLGLIYARH
jgi:hypothetical protein